MIKAALILLLLAIFGICIMRFWAFSHKERAIIKDYPKWILVLSCLIALEFVGVFGCLIFGILLW